MILTLSTVSYAERELVFVGESPTQLVYYDTDSLTRKGHPVSSATVEAVMDLKKPVTAGGKTARSLVTTMQIDCKKGLSRIVTIRAYSGPKGTGKVTDSENKPQAWTQMPRNAVVFLDACNIESEGSEWGAVAAATRPNPERDKKLADSMAKLKGMVNGPQEAMEDAELKRQLRRHTMVLKESFQEECIRQMGHQC
jgi:hypothetical protein